MIVRTSRMGCAIEVVKHKMAMYKLWKSLGKKRGTNVTAWQVFCHDFTKIFSILIIGDRLTSKYHKRKNHHSCLTDELYAKRCVLPNGRFHVCEETGMFSEAYLDWACARMTKIDKQLDAVETGHKYYPAFEEAVDKYYYAYGYK